MNILKATKTAPTCICGHLVWNYPLHVNQLLTIYIEQILRYSLSISVQPGYKKHRMLILCTHYRTEKVTDSVSLMSRNTQLEIYKLYVHISQAR